MAIKRINENPTITDSILFDIYTPDVDGCFIADPYKVESITIYYIERGFNGSSIQEYDKTIYNSSALTNYESAKKLACQSPTETNLAALSKATEELGASVSTEKFYYKQAKAIATFGTYDLPAWLSTDTGYTLIEHITEDEDENTIYGHFQLTWQPNASVREGDYFICWNWYPVISGNSLTYHEHFSLNANTQLTTSIPTHATKPNKYETLLERYLPEQFKLRVSNVDLTPEVISELNNSISQGFAFVEDLANQIVDLIDSNATHEEFLPSLGNLFNLKLKSNDSTLWRRQIKRSIPLFKKKGTIGGLQEALAQAGMSFLELVRLWQVISPYTWQEHFLVEEEVEFVLSKQMILPIDLDNFEIYFRESEEVEWEEITSDYVDFNEVDGLIVMTWVGDTLSVDPITLIEGNSIRVIYKINEVPDSNAQDIEDYIRTLPLIDQRDERDQNYPIKNWNIRALEENDIMFDIIISTRHPYFDPVIYGKVRTEFPYSENIYNMDEYNGSKRDSIIPCDIDKNFVDSCQYCQSSKFNIDIEIEELCNDRITEAQNIIEEFIPFHAQIQSLNINGGINEYVKSPEEEIDVCITIQGEEFTISGNAQFIFNRVIEDGLTTNQVLRDVLADMNLEISDTGTAYNTALTVFSPDVKFASLPIIESNNVIEILSPHDNAGEYSVSNAYGNTVEISGVSETPDIIPTNSFTFNLYNILYEASSAGIVQYDYFVFSDENVNFNTLGTKSDFTVEHGPDYSGGPWKIKIASDEFTINNVLPNNTIILNDPTELLPKINTSSISYTLLDDNDDIISNSTTGVLTVTRRAIVDLSIDLASDSIEDVSNVTKIGQFLLYDGNKYEIIGFVSENEFYISNYSDGTVAGQSIKIYRRLANNEVGYLNYKGLKLNTISDHETGLGILNGQNAPVSEDDVLENNLFKENFLVKIDSEYYLITNIDGTEITLNGLPQDWKTITGGGTSVSYEIYKFDKLGITLTERDYPPMSAHSFEPSGEDIPNIEEFIDRRGNDVVDISLETVTSLLSALSSGSEVSDHISQEESISVHIEWSDGSEAEYDI